ncbi:MAG: LysM peptidoglycan-binding domain-containing protein [Geopsychrobacter sp.]|nr:LysM peptidoglycan-binding domain-containing protein [Geopsychrobacter sp.]
MNKLIHVWLSLMFLLIGLPSLSAVAAESRIYTIKQGDTLWGISERFIKDPYYWPSLWANNPDITNPHLIYPGQKVRIYNGRIELIPEYPGGQKTKPVIEAPATVATQQPAIETPTVETPVITPAPEKIVDMFKVSVSGDGFIRTDEESLGSLVDSVDSRTLLTQNDLVFLDMKNLAQVEIGDTYSLFSQGPLIKHPITQKNFGRMMFELGFVQVTAINSDTVTAKIGDIYREIERGAELFEYVPPTHEIELKKAVEELTGHILSGQQIKLTQGQNDLIYVDLGQDQGLQVGNILYISRPQHTTELADKQKKLLDLPDKLLGAAIVVRTRNKTASAFIFKSAAETHVGDQVMAASE